MNNVKKQQPNKERCVYFFKVLQLYIFAIYLLAISALPMSNLYLWQFLTYDTFLAKMERGYISTGTCDVMVQLLEKYLVKN